VAPQEARGLFSNSALQALMTHTGQVLFLCEFSETHRALGLSTNRVARVVGIALNTLHSNLHPALESGRAGTDV
jgi:DNA-directed RNA polymerase specialized sigma24 family protein